MTMDAISPEREERRRRQKELADQSLSNGLCKGVRFTPLKEKHCDYGCDQPGARGASSEAEGAC